MGRSFDQAVKSLLLNLKKGGIMDLPDRTNSDYDYVNLNRLKNLPQTHAEARPVEKQVGIVFSNGFFMKEASETPQGLVVLPIEEALKSYGGVLNKRLNIRETDYFADLNLKSYKEGVFIYVPPQMNFTLKVNQIIKDMSVMTPRLHIFLGVQAKLSLSVSYAIEEKMAPLISEVIDTHLSEESCFDLKYDARGFPEELIHFSFLKGVLKRGSRFHAINTTNGSKISRFDYSLELQQEGAHVDLKGLTHLFDTREAHTNVSISHKAPHCTSSQLFKTLLEDTSASSFQGKIKVDQKAQKTEAFQLNKNLLLDKKARAYCKPNLEIFADDVKASHGATFGHLDEEQLFYLKARGFSEKSAKNILIKGFTEELLQEFLA
jgi:Fe-S cluster assembly protein SufD